MRTNEELLEWARDLRTRWDGGWMIDGRPIGAGEMHAMNRLVSHEWSQRIERDGCCGDGPNDSGKCPHTYQQCPMFREAWRLERKIFQEVNGDE